MVDVLIDDQLASLLSSGSKDKKSHIWSREFGQLQTHYDNETHALWCILKPRPVPVLTLTLLNNIRAAQDMIAEACHTQKQSAPKYIIWLSDNATIFNLGLDLNYLSQLILNRDRKGLATYLQLCIDVSYINLLKLDIKSTITISLIRGKAYGGGLEAALLSDVVFAEKGARCCFPEARYNLLPSVGSITMLMRKFNHSDFTNHFFHGGCIALTELMKMKAIENIVNENCGIQEIQNYIKEIQPKHRVYSYLYTEKSKSIILSHHEIEEFTNMWLDVAMNMSNHDINKLKRLASVIQRKYGHN